MNYTLLGNKTNKNSTAIFAIIDDKYLHFIESSKQNNYMYNATIA